MAEMVPKPRLIRRACGGYLAVSPKSARFRIGVTADTEAEVEHKFWNAYVEWCETFPLEECPRPPILFVDGLLKEPTIKAAVHKHPLEK